MNRLALIPLLLVSLATQAQSKKQVRQAIDSAAGVEVILECARTDVSSLKFFVPAVKIGDQFYTKKKRKPLPKTWFIWDYKEIKK